MASFHPHYLTFTPQTYHQPVYRFRSRPTQTTSQSHPHTEVRVQPRNTYNHTYIKFCLDKTKQPLTKSRQNNLHSVHTRPCRIYEQSGPNNKQQSTTHGNAPKGSGSYPTQSLHQIKTNMRHIHASIVSRHLATRENKKYCAHLHHTLAALKRNFPVSLVAPFPNSEQTNLPSSNHTYTKSTSKHIHHHYTPSTTSTHTTQIISSTAPTYAPHQTPPPPLTRVMGVVRHQQQSEHFMKYINSYLSNTKTYFLL